VCASCTHSVRILTDGSGETASTPKIVSDVACTSTCRCKRYDEPAHAASTSAQMRKQGLGLPDPVVAARRRMSRRHRWLILRVDR
jgi:hypothetical protein